METHSPSANKAFSLDHKDQNKPRVGSCGQQVAGTDKYTASAELSHNCQEVTSLPTGLQRATKVSAVDRRSWPEMSDAHEPWVMYPSVHILSTVAADKNRRNVCLARNKGGPRTEDTIGYLSRDPQGRVTYTGEQSFRAQQEQRAVMGPSMGQKLHQCLCPPCNGFLRPRYRPYTACWRDMERPKIEQGPTHYLPEVSADI